MIWRSGSDLGGKNGREWQLWGDENRLDWCEVGRNLPMDGNVNPSQRTATQVRTDRKKDSIAISITLDPDMIVRRPGAGLWEENPRFSETFFQDSSMDYDKPQTRNGITYGWKLDWTKRNVLVRVGFGVRRARAGRSSPQSRGHAKTLNWRVSSVKGRPLPALVAYRDPSEFLAATRDSQPRR